MKKARKINTIIVILLVCFFSFFSGYNSVVEGNFAYADTTTDNWQAVTTNEELVEAFRYYCKSRDLTIEGSIADAVTSFTTTTFNNICNALGYDLTALQAHLKKETDGSNIRFLFDSTGITAYNNIFAQFLQDNELEVGDTANDTVYDGRYVPENNSLIWVVNGDVKSSVLSSQNNLIMKGSYYMYDTAYCYNYGVNNGGTSYINVSVSNYSASILVKQNYIPASNLYYYCLCLDNVDYIFNGSGFDNNNIIRTGIEGFPIIVYEQNTSKMYIGGMVKQYYDNDIRYTIYKSTQLYGWGSYTTPITINITSNNTVINNNNYEGDTIINNDGTPSEPDTPIPSPSPDYTPAEDWDIDLPDLDVPNWILSGKENKFPFDIPFNVMYALTLLQAEPQAPELEGTLDFGFYEWEYDIDLSEFDTVAEICRNMEFLAFLTGLMLMTRKLIWG